ncbi:MAG: sodium:solute symporter family protein [Pirellulaceae bacterium]
MDPGAIASAAQMRMYIIIGYLGLLVLLGLFASRMGRGTKTDYLLASHSIGPFLLLMSLFGTTMTAFAMVGSSAEAYSNGILPYGLMASSSGIVHSLCFFLVGIKLWSFGKRYGYSTQIEFFRDRLDSQLIGYVLFPILVVLLIPYLLLGVYASGMAIQAMTAGAFPDFAMFADAKPSMNGGVPRWLGSLVVCGVVLFYVFFGGMRGTAWANAFQTMVFMVLGALAVYLLAMKLGGHDTLLENLRELSSKVDADHTTRRQHSQLEFFTYLLIPLSVGMFPHIFQHWLTAKNAESFKLAVVCHPLFIMIVWVPCVFIGIWATTLNLPPGVAADPNTILPFLVKKELAPMIAGLLAAGILAAIMSSLDSQFLCVGTMFSTDIAEPLIGKQLDGRQQVWVARSFIVAIVIVTYLISLLKVQSVFKMGVWSFAGFASLFPVVFASLYWKRLTAAGALAGILTAIGSWLYLFQRGGWGADENFALEFFWQNEVVRANPVVLPFIGGIVAMVLTSLITKPPKNDVIAKFFPVNKS